MLDDAGFSKSHHRENNTTEAILCYKVSLIYIFEQFQNNTYMKFWDIVWMVSLKDILIQ
jgi:hypothetical protein